MVIELLLNWECFRYLGCIVGEDLTNTASTYIGIIIGTVLGASISMLIYMRQRKTTEEQNMILKRIEALGIKQEHIINHIQTFEENHEKMLVNHNKMLNNFSALNKKIDSLLESK
jgi:hypothetical protein